MVRGRRGVWLLSSVEDRGLVDGKVHTIEQERSPHICGMYSKICLLYIAI